MFCSPEGKEYGWPWMFPFPFSFLILFCTFSDFITRSVTRVTDDATFTLSQPESRRLFMPSEKRKIYFDLLLGLRKWHKEACVWSQVQVIYVTVSLLPFIFLVLSTQSHLDGKYVMCLYVIPDQDLDVCISPTHFMLRFSDKVCRMERQLVNWLKVLKKALQW